MWDEAEDNIQTLQAKKNPSVNGLTLVFVSHMALVAA